MAPWVDIRGVHSSAGTSFDHPGGCRQFFNPGILNQLGTPQDPKFKLIILNSKKEDQLSILKNKPQFLNYKADRVVEFSILTPVRQLFTTRPGVQYYLLKRPFSLDVRATLNEDHQMIQKPWSKINMSKTSMPAMLASYCQDKISFRFEAMTSFWVILYNRMGLSYHDTLCPSDEKCII